MLLNCDSKRPAPRPAAFPSDGSSRPPCFFGFDARVATAGPVRATRIRTREAAQPVWLLRVLGYENLSVFGMFSEEQDNGRQRAEIRRAGPQGGDWVWRTRFGAGRNQGEGVREPCYLLPTYGPSLSGAMAG